MKKLSVRNRALPKQIVCGVFSTPAVFYSLFTCKPSSLHVAVVDHFTGIVPATDQLESHAKLNFQVLFQSAIAKVAHTATMISIFKNLYPEIHIYMIFHYSLIQKCQFYFLRVFSVFISHVIKTKNRNRSINKFKNLGYDRWLQYKQPRQESGLCCF